MSTHIKIDRCDTPKLRLLKSYSLGDLWKCDCGQEWRWSSWHRQVAYRECVRLVGHVPKQKVGVKQVMSICTHQFAPTIQGVPNE